MFCLIERWRRGGENKNKIEIVIKQYGKYYENIPEATK